MNGQRMLKDPLDGKPFQKRVPNSSRHLGLDAGKHLPEEFENRGESNRWNGHQKTISAVGMKRKLGKGEGAPVWKTAPPSRYQQAFRVRVVTRDPLFSVFVVVCLAGRGSRRKAGVRVIRCIPSLREHQGRSTSHHLSSPRGKTQHKSSGC